MAGNPWFAKYEYSIKSSVNTKYLSDNLQFTASVNPNFRNDFNYIISSEETLTSVNTLKKYFKYWGKEKFGYELIESVR